MTKDERQLIAETKWKDNKGKGTLRLCPRFGKTRIAENIIRKCNDKHKEQSEDIFKVIIIGPNKIVKKNAKENLNIIPGISIYTIGELINIIKDIGVLSCHLLILDEIDRLLTTESYKAISFIKSTFRLGLTGSNLSKEDLSKLNQLELPVIDELSEEEALSNNWIANYEEYNLPTELDDYDKEKYAKYSKVINEVLEQFNGMRKRLNKLFTHPPFNSDFDVALSAFLGKYIITKYNTKVFMKPSDIRSLIAKEMGYKETLDVYSEYGKSRLIWKPENIYEKTKQFKNYITRRNNILTYNRNKINAVLEIIKRNDVPTICFNQSIEMVDEIANHFPLTSIPYHSEIKSRYMINPDTGKYYTTVKGEDKKIGATTLKNLAIAGMKRGNIKQLIVAQSLNESLTIENIEQVITTGGDTNPNRHIQRTARGKTFDYTNPNKTCIIINIYVDDFILGNELIYSRDKQKLKLRQRESESVVTWVESVDDIFKKD